MEYKILITYNTGDGFHTKEGVRQVLEMGWKNYDVAYANIKRIEEHYKWYQATSNASYNKKSAKDHKWLYEGKDWYNNNKLPSPCREYSIVLYTDDNKPWKIWPFWVGYFESLVSAELIQDLPKIEF